MDIPAKTKNNNNNKTDIQTELNRRFKDRFMNNTNAAAEEEDTLRLIVLAVWLPRTH